MNLRLGKEAKTFDLDKITDPILKRKLESISKIGTSILEGDDLDNYVDVTSKLAKIYSTAKVPDFKDPTKMVSLEPEITLIMGESRDPEELEYYWTKHRDSTGGKMGEMYKEYIKLTNKAAKYVQFSL